MIDPFGLLGVTVASSLAEVKKAFYALSLVAHPDKGGTADDMAVVYNAYRYVHDQLSAVNRTDTVEGLEERFAAFCLVQTEAPPCFNDIALDAGEASRFNQAFAHAFTNGAQEYFGTDDNPMSGGYGESMERSKYATNDDSAEVAPVVYRPVSPPPEGNEPLAGRGAPFETHIVPYVEPGCVVSCSVPLSRGHGDYGLDRPMQMTDYCLAFNTTPEPVAQEKPSRSVEDVLAERHRDDIMWSATAAATATLDI